MKKLKDNVYWVGTNDWEVRGFHGDELSTHKGTTYNAYLIKDDKNVLIDTVSEPLTEIFLERIKKVIDLGDIDYVVINHAEPDHSGALTTIMELCPNAKIVASVKGKESIQRHFHKNWDVQTVKTGDKINIGKRDLMFIEATMLHWPDTMFTYLTEANILFSNDAFGQHYASSELFNDKVDKAEVHQEALKYYANILTPFSKFVIKKIDEIKSLNLPLDIIAPSHGIIWRENPMQIVEKYYEWAKGESEDSVVIIYNSMYGATKKMAEYIGLGLEAAGVEHRIYKTSNTDLNDLLTQIFKSKGIICGSSTINNGSLVSLYPVLEEIRGLKYTGKVGAAFGSYGWSGESPKELQEALERAKVEIIQDSIKFKYMPNEEELEQCFEFGKSFGEKMLGK
ncbi:anaerobic nitric oxide reductase flavorubredoxin NorV [Gottschalkia acidurici 9a]|uniref:Anaerobic nitric oxide reductase flavorubredoxin NorV n=1 Tax=Gottschalkia acidurici (strain ATCC 7906 / DSM 604 / BCRC 14475 / CIP 104303 / KCTC 5404 / NCIMB 10678 / 9a) TaxID=1128398 RepID=K0B4N8_GOTA9|nr:flavodoxin domain-containing protein [Gottschalkia acidurici]AFS79526.1 anaerobic nitric oxide reductase flavorubredoxin NorV [Gottschalkia acidurici 9a]